MLKWILVVSASITARGFTMITEKLFASTTIYSKSKDTSINPTTTALFMETPKTRREAFTQAITSVSIISSLLVNAYNKPANAAAQVAVGEAEKLCREKGNCLETGQLDGAVGWNWGAKDRCDASDPKCGVNGQLLENGESSFIVPDTLGLKISKIIELEIRLGKNLETGVLRIGLYGENCPKSADQILEYVSNYGLVTNEDVIENGYFDDVLSSPVSFSKSGELRSIYPGEKLDFGIASQEAAFGKKSGLSISQKKRYSSISFQPQPRPDATTANIIQEEASPRSHNAPGLISIPSKGIGYNNELFTNEDKAYESSFQITASSNLDYMDKEKRKVIGQIVDEESMKFLSRLASIPTQKGLKGIANINYGPPLIRVSLDRVTILNA